MGLANAGAGAGVAFVFDVSWVVTEGEAWRDVWCFFSVDVFLCRLVVGVLGDSSSDSHLDFLVDMVVWEEEEERLICLSTNLMLAMQRQFFIG